MYRKSASTYQLDAFASVLQHGNSRLINALNDTNSWHNKFFQHTFSNIDEDTFSPLYNKTKMGAPNSSIRILVAMIVLKEGFGLSDEQLFERCDSDLMFRNALGINNLNEATPCGATYYDFRKKCRDYESATGIDLFQLCFEQITSKQVVEFKVNGKMIRMDSKLFGSNIAWMSRYEIIHNVLVSTLKMLSQSNFIQLSDSMQSFIQELLDEDPQKTIYYSNTKTVSERIQLSGELMYELSLKFDNELKNNDLFHRVFNDQFTVEQQKAIARPKTTIAATSVQSPYDTDATYRNKPGNDPVRGYSENISETCNGTGLQLIVSSIVNLASTADNDFFQAAIAQSQIVTQTKVETTHLDGAYQSSENREFSKDEHINFYTTGIQGRVPRFQLELTGEILFVKDLKTNTIQEAVKVSAEKWKIETEKKPRYFTHKDIEMADLRRFIAQLPSELKKIRNNVEATIFHFACNLRNNKTRYRGLFQQRLFANARCLWINLIRITKYMDELCKKTNKNTRNMKNSHIFLIYSAFAIAKSLKILFLDLLPSKSAFILPKMTLQKCTC